MSNQMLSGNAWLCGDYLSVGAIGLVRRGSAASLAPSAPAPRGASARAAAAGRPWKRARHLPSRGVVPHTHGATSRKKNRTKNSPARGAQGRRHASGFRAAAGMTGEEINGSVRNIKGLAAEMPAKEINPCGVQ
ncbi:hypothetical protein ACVWW6_005536 [Bradyrhizobium sp. USDA 3311]